MTTATGHTSAIRASKVIGTNVYNGAGDKIGKAYRIDDARGRYIEFVKQSLGNAHLDGMKIVVDCGGLTPSYLGPADTRVALPQ